MNSSTLTIRLPRSQREALKRAAGKLKKTESEYLRDLVARDLAEVSLGERLGDLSGCLRSSEASHQQAHPLKARVRAHNWRG